MTRVLCIWFQGKEPECINGFSFNAVVSMGLIFDSSHVCTVHTPFPSRGEHGEAKHILPKYVLYTPATW